MELELGAVVVVGRSTSSGRREVVDAVADVRPPVADLDAALAALAVADLQRVELRCGRCRCSGSNATTRSFVEERRVEDVFVRRLGDRLAGVLR